MVSCDCCSFFGLWSLAMLYIVNYLVTSMMHNIPLYSDVVFTTFLIQVVMNKQIVRKDDLFNSFPIASIIGAIILIPAVLAHYSPVAAEILTQMALCTQLLHFLRWRAPEYEVLMSISIILICAILIILMFAFNVILHWTVAATVVIYVALLWWSKTIESTRVWMDHVKIEDLITYWCTVRVSGWCIGQFLDNSVETSTFVSVSVICGYTLLVSLMKQAYSSYAIGIWCLLINPYAFVCGVGSYLLPPALGVVISIACIYVIGLSWSSLIMIIHAAVVWYAVDTLQQHKRLDGWLGDNLSNLKKYAHVVAVSIFYVGTILPPLLIKQTKLNYRVNLLQLLMVVGSIVVLTILKQWYTKSWIYYANLARRGYHPLIYILPLSMTMILRPTPIHITPMHSKLLMAWRIILGTLAISVALFKTIQRRVKMFLPPIHHRNATTSSGPHGMTIDNQAKKDD